MSKGKAALILAGLLGLYIPVRLLLAQAQAPHPQAILTLGGGIERETYTAQFAQAHTDLPIWVSSGIAQPSAKTLFQQARIDEHRITLDYRATDTVTNFTTLVSTLQQQQIQHVYLITDRQHMPRARAIAFFVFGSHGITTTPIAFPSHRPPESTLATVRDINRSLLWLITGRTGASLKPPSQSQG
ncbi:YdcF family protein [Lyngbya confervoides]|uniref:YdcF family protein n=1 Tax=Lyngbya confervoides BDU141951 TaxID=1574623 RepID=A0ABD4T7W2_9CYAN|nr:YdcF family protein [Lyngbya confervoides]MCM1984599.1 YdcF family protein [Lyngbya confervoides BDU141951]